MSSTFDNGRAATSTFPPSFADWLTENTPYSNAISALKTWRHRSTNYHDVYDPDYFETLERSSWNSAPVIARSIVDHLNPVRVVDLGCGTGNLIDNLRSLGIKSVGADFSDLALAYCEKRCLDVKKIDFTDAEAIRCPVGRFDLAISLDVAHQLPKPSAISHVAYLCHHADRVLFTAPPCASDRLPKCVRPAEFWIEQFRARGFVLDYTLSAIFKAEWPAQERAPSRKRRPLLFQRSRR
ncbi:MAG: class I SAM-dependent methyltransferase [Alphaproteobacteria bacterium]|nr:class I SAM-dependent methyltransferase [Alphaproteobacteria bacterium]